MSTVPIRKRRIRVAPAIVVPVVLAIVYVLSIGPVYWLLWSRHASARPLRLVWMLYAPLFWLVDNVPWLHDVYVWYVRLWIP